MAILKALLQPHSKIDILDAELIIAHTLKKPRAWVLAHADYNLTKTQERKIRALFARRQKGEPLAYLTGHKEFFGLDFLVDKRVLVPRPETELLVEETIKIIKKQPTILIDVGTGSGCVAIAINKAMRQKNIKTIATDISKPALAVAKKNARCHGVKIKFLHGNLLSPITKIIKPNTLHLIPKHLVITANLPYGWREWKNNCSMETRGLKFEPPQALYTGKHGLQLYEDLFKQISKLPNTFYPTPITLLLEFDQRQTTLLKKLIKKHLPMASVEIKKDLAGRDRVTIIKL